ncbi:hypothetical protein GCM10023097_19980 [Streptomyces collinus]
MPGPACWAGPGIGSGGRSNRVNWTGSDTYNKDTRASPHARSDCMPELPRDPVSVRVQRKGPLRLAMHGTKRPGRDLQEPTAGWVSLVPVDH